MIWCVSMEVCIIHFLILCGYLSKNKNESEVSDDEYSMESYTPPHAVIPTYLNSKLIDIINCFHSRERKYRGMRDEDVKLKINRHSNNC